VDAQNPRGFGAFGIGGRAAICHGFNPVMGYGFRSGDIVVTQQWWRIYHSPKKSGFVISKLFEIQG
jgi:hypothetical protein